MNTRSFVPQIRSEESITVRKIRELPIPGMISVREGEDVECTDIIGKVDLPGELTILRIAEQIGIEPEDVTKRLSIREGSEVKVGQILAEYKALFGLFTTRYSCPTDGTVEFISSATAHVGVRGASEQLDLSAYISGKVVEVNEGSSVTIETNAAFVQGIFGVGGEQQGKLLVLDILRDKRIEASEIPSGSSGTILVGGATISIEALRRASSLGIKGVVTGSIDDTTLREFIGKDLGVALTGNEEVPLTLIITEGFGHLALFERTYELLRRFTGKLASINGATQVRAGAVRPEIIIPHQNPKSAQSESAEGGFSLGKQIRLIRVPYFGMYGTITEIPHEPMKLETGAFTRVIKERLDTAVEVVVPRANVEMISS